MCSLLQDFTSLICDFKGAACGSAERGSRCKTSSLSSAEKLQVEAE